MDIDNIENIKVDLTEDFFKKILYWIICKYDMDEFRREQSSSKRALLGGFIERWLNKAPEFLIFDELLKDKNYSAINDFFFYTKGESKNAPDILGLVDDNGEKYPFALFEDKNWKIVEGTPFIEMKTFRSDQNLVTIPCTQFYEDHYYAIVESHLKDNYLFSIFDDELFENEEYYNFISSQSEDELIISNDEGVIKKPDKLTKNNELGYYTLLGIYRGADLKQFCKIVKQGDNPIYYFEEINPPSSPRNPVNPPIKFKSGIHYFDDDSDKNIPFNIDVSEGAELILRYKSKKTLDVEVRGHVEVDGNRLDQVLRRLQFKNFEKNGSAEEVAMTKSIIKCFNEDISATAELVLEFDSIVK